MKSIYTLLALGLLLLPTAAHAVGGEGDPCNDTRYQGDTDVELDLHLYSEAIWGFSCQVNDRISNLSSTEDYEVEYQAAGFYVGRLQPLKARSAHRESWKSCISSNAPARFTRLFPRRDAPRTVNIAPACNFGWVLIDELKSLLDFFGAARNLTSVLDETDLQTGESSELLAATASFDLQQSEGLWHYSLLVENSFDRPIDVFIDGPWARLVSEPMERSLEPGAAVEFLLQVPVGAPGDEPAEHTASLEFDDWGVDYGHLDIPILAPGDLGDQLRGDIDGNGSLNLSDVISLNRYLFGGGAAPSCHEAADFNQDSRVDLSDSISLLNHLFLGAPGPQDDTADCSSPRPDVQLIVTELPAAEPAPALAPGSEMSFQAHSH